MQKILDGVVVVGFLLVDFFLFHDFAAPGETFTFVDYLVGTLSIVVIARAIYSLASKSE